MRGDFALVKTDGGVSKTRCRHCGSLFEESMFTGSSAVARMRKHIDACECATDEVRKAHGTQAKVSYQKKRPAPDRDIGSMHKYTATMSDEHKARVGSKLAKWAYHSRIPFNAFDSPYFVDAMKDASFQQFVPPSARVIGGRLLTTEVQSCDAAMKAAIAKHGIVHVQADGVTDALSVANFCVTLVVDAEAYFYCKIPNDGSSQNAEYYAGKLSAVFKEVIEMGGDIGSLLLDNTAVNPAASRILKQTYPRVIYGGCCAHGANLLTCDLLCGGAAAGAADHPVQVTVFKVKEIVKRGRLQSVRPMYEREFLMARKVKLEGDKVEHYPRRMTLNGETRWLTHWRMLRYCRENREGLTLLAIDPRGKDLLGDDVWVRQIVLAIVPVNCVT